MDTGPNPSFADGVAEILAAHPELTQADLERAFAFWQMRNGRGGPTTLEEDQWFRQLRADTGLLLSELNRLLDLEEAATPPVPSSADVSADAA